MHEFDLSIDLEYNSCVVDFFISKQFTFHTNEYFYDTPRFKFIRLLLAPSVRVAEYILPNLTCGLTIIELNLRLKL